LKGSLGVTLKEVRPTIFLGVPRVWEKMQEAMTAAGKANGAFKKWIASYARGVGLRDNLAGWVQHDLLNVFVLHTLLNVFVLHTLLNVFVSYTLLNIFVLYTFILIY